MFDVLKVLGCWFITQTVYKIVAFAILIIRHRPFWDFYHSYVCQILGDVTYNHPRFWVTPPTTRFWVAPILNIPEPCSSMLFLWCIVIRENVAEVTWNLFSGGCQILPLVNQSGNFSLAIWEFCVLHWWCVLFCCPCYWNIVKHFYYYSAFVGHF